MNLNEHVLPGSKMARPWCWVLSWAPMPPSSQEQPGLLERFLHWYSLSLTTQITLALLGPFYRTLSLQQKVMYENIEIPPAY